MRRKKIRWFMVLLLLLPTNYYYSPSVQSSAGVRKVAICRDTSLEQQEKGSVRSGGLGTEVEKMSHIHPMRSVLVVVGSQRSSERGSRRIRPC